MPVCICGSKCSLPAANLHPQHRCPGCKEMIHYICGIYDETKQIHNNMWCFTCYGGLKLPAKQMAASSTSPEALSTYLAASLKPSPPVSLPFPQLQQSPAAAQAPALTAVLGEQSRPSPHDPKIPGPTASSTAPARLRKATTKKMTDSKKMKAPKKPKKTKAVQIEIPFEDLFLNASVAFALDGDISSWSKGVDFRPHSQMIGTKYYLFGTVIKNNKKKNFYIVE